MSIRSELIFSASAASTNDPQVQNTILNDFDGTPAIVRSSAGTYALQLLKSGVAQALFTENKTQMPNEVFYSFMENDGSVSNRKLSFSWQSSTTILITNSYLTGGLVDEFPTLFISIYVVQTSVTAGAGYCSQADLEMVLGVAQLSQLSNDTTNMTIPDAGVVADIIARETSIIDGKIGKTWIVPFVVGVNCTSIPTQIKQVCIDRSIYRLFARKVAMMEMPKQWDKIYNDACDLLEEISCQQVMLNGTPTAINTKKQTRFSL
jgi:phage gp36-like protein